MAQSVVNNPSLIINNPMIDNSLDNPINTNTNNSNNNNSVISKNTSNFNLSYSNQK